MIPFIILLAIIASLIPSFNTWQTEKRKTMVAKEKLENERLNTKKEILMLEKEILELKK